MNIHNFTPKRFNINTLAANLFSLGLLSCTNIPALGQSLPGDERMSGKGVEGAFEKQRAVLQMSSAAIYHKNVSMGFGTIMSSDGYILTKRSELYTFDKTTKKTNLKKDLMVVVNEKRFSKVKLIASDIRWDLALLKIEAESLTAVEWADIPNLEQGMWVVTNGSTSKYRRRVNIGIISAKAREIKGEVSVMVGLRFKKEDEKNDPSENKGVEILKVSKGSGAETAGVKEADIFKKVDGKEVNKFKQIIDILREKQPGDFIEVELLRGEQLLTKSIELKPREEIVGAGPKKRGRNDQMSGDFSTRRNGFPMVIQHDIDQNSRQTGGPLLNLDGKAVGINIARVNRAESFAIPAKEAQQVYKELLKSLSK